MWIPGDNIAAWGILSIGPLEEYIPLPLGIVCRFPLFWAWPHFLVLYCEKFQTSAAEQRECVCWERRCSKAAGFIICLIAVSFVSDLTQLSLYLVSTRTMEYSTQIIYKVCVLASSVGQSWHLHLPFPVIILTLCCMISKHYLGHVYTCTIMNTCYHEKSDHLCCFSQVGKRIQNFFYSIGFLKSL